MSKTIHNPHDRFLKHFLSHHQAARDLLQACLPDALKQQLNFDSIQTLPTTFVDAELRQSVCDFLFSVQFRDQPGYVYTLVEGQSNATRDMPIRMMKYIIAIMEWNLKHHDTLVSRIVPLILYTGAESYRYSTRFVDLFTDPEPMLETFIDAFGLIAIQAVSDTHINSYPWFGGHHEPGSPGSI